ncbi:MAG: DUF4403 family protein [Gemmatimonadetes bacterium]|nr:DUF4403 family protein [Gemmatimonadota bacterium]
MSRLLPSAFVLAVAALAVNACSRAADVDAPPPLVVDDLIDTLPPPEPSVIEADIRYDLDPALAAIERAAPRRFGDITEKLPVPGNKRAHFAFAASRSPFRIRFDGRRATVSSVVEYEGRGWYDPPVGPEVSAACGTNGVPRPRARLTLVSDLTLTEAWGLKARSRLSDVRAYSDSVRDRCRVTVFRIDVTDKVLGATRNALGGPLRSLDQSIARLNTRARVESWWRTLSRPIRISDSVWFTINPADVRRGDVRSDSGALVIPVRLMARPRFLTGNRPNDFDLFTPLPPLVRGDSIGRGMRVSLEAVVGYDFATTMLRRALRQKRIERGNRHVIIEDVELTGIGAGRVALGVRFGGSMRGRFFVIGTPQYDPALDQLVVPDLDFDLRTTDRLVRSVAWLKDDEILAFLRQRARFPVEEGLDRLREVAERAMNRELAPGVRLEAKLDQATPTAVRAFRSGLRVRATAAGAAHLDIDRGTVASPDSAARPVRP